MLGQLKTISGGDNLDFDVKYKDGGSNSNWGKILIYSLFFFLSAQCAYALNVVNLNPIYVPDPSADRGSGSQVKGDVVKTPAQRVYWAE